MEAVATGRRGKGGWQNFAGREHEAGSCRRRAAPDPQRGRVSAQGRQAYNAKL